VPFEATATDEAPETGIGVPAMPVARSTGLTVSSPEFATYAVLPSGVIAIENGLVPTGIGVPAVPVARSTGVSVPRMKQGA
jgi:hypothetical protein